VTRANTREEILSAALALFTEIGYEATTIALIQSRSGASIGSIYHHFGSKEGIAEALCDEGIQLYRDRLKALLTEHEGAPRAGISAAIRHHLEWIEENRDLAQFLSDRGLSSWRTIQSRDSRAFGETISAAFSSWMAPHVAAGRIKPLSHTVLTAWIIGPAQFISGAWLAGRDEARPTSYAEGLSDIGWIALAGHRSADDY